MTIKTVTALHSKIMAMSITYNVICMKKVQKASKQSTPKTKNPQNNNSIVETSTIKTGFINPINHQYDHRVKEIHFGVTDQ